MQNFITATVIAATMVSMINPAFQKDETSFIEALENSRVETYSDFCEIVESSSEYSLESMCTYSQTIPEYADEVYFNYEIDYENDRVEVDVIYETIESTSVLSTTSQKSGSAIHETYSMMGNLIYTVKVNGKFSYDSTTCSVISKSGSFEKPTLSLWSSTPTISSGRMSTTKVYARISGTATCVLDHETYRLTLMCDANGKLTNSFTRP